jgi:ABC-type dipeptide/oligopeptide/nickel transport system ATPase component
MSEPAAVGTLERGLTARVLDDPQDPYTQRLRASVPRPVFCQTVRGKGAA